MQIEPTVVDRGENLVVVHVSVRDEIDRVVVEDLLERLLPRNSRFASRRAVPGSVNENDDPRRLLSVHAAEVVDEPVDLLIRPSKRSVDVTSGSVERFRLDRADQVGSEIGLGGEGHEMRLCRSENRE